MMITMNDQSPVAMVPEAVDKVFTKLARFYLVLYKFSRQKGDALPIACRLNNHMQIVNNHKTPEI